jgi:Domain of Unknown Function (DUF1080)
MPNRRCFLIAAAICLFAPQLWQAGPSSFSEDKIDSHGRWKVLLDGQSLKGWHPLDASKPNTWLISASVKLNPQDEHFFSIEPGKGVLVNGEKGQSVNLVSDMAHGDIEAHIEFVVSKGSNSGIYFMGLYEIQVLDSYGKTNLDFSDCGGVYARWIDEKNVGGNPPRVNASRPPGEWQSFDIQFRAPRFEVNGKKTENARFIKVVHNGRVVHENVEVDGPTRAAMETPETSLGPLMLQGDHGPVAYRNIRIRSLQ